MSLRKYGLNIGGFFIGENYLHEVLEEVKKDAVPAVATVKRHHAYFEAPNPRRALALAILRAEGLIELPDAFVQGHTYRMTHAGDDLLRTFSNPPDEKN